MKLYSLFSRFFYDLFNKPSTVIVDDTNGNNLSCFEKQCKKWTHNLSLYSSKLPPISFVYRLKNAEAFIELSVSSIIPIADEIVFVDNGSSDNTLNIISKLMNKYGDSVSFRLEFYEQEIVTQGADYKKRLSLNPAGSLADYYNYCFNLAKNDWVFKIDAHKILIPSVLPDILKRINAGDEFVFLRGYDFYGRDIYFEPLLYKKSSGAFYVDGDFFEHLNYKEFIKISNIYFSRINKGSFYHLKSLINSPCI